MKTTLIRTSLGILMLASLGLTTTAAQADWGRDGQGHRQAAFAYKQSQAYSRQIDARQERQQDRIQAGRRDGSLTRGEFRNLMHEQREIQAMQHRFRADGRIDAHEFKRLDRALDRADRDIRKERHDRQARNTYNAGPRFN
jgi:uncharacterized membrane protein YebE (DUF533 family)